MENNFIITSYYTHNTPYVEVAHDCLMKSVKNLDIKTDIRGVENLGSWKANTSYKSKFLRKMLDVHKENIIFVDADAEILKYPELFNNIPEEHNIAAHILDRNKWYNRDLQGTTELLSGTLFIRNCDESKHLLDIWISACKNHPNIWEQVLLQKVLLSKNINVYQLPIEYCYIASMPDGSEPNVKCDNVVIRHTQASRKLKNLIR